MKTQECKGCPAGSYSLGDGVRYDGFSKLPDGFSIENFVDDSEQVFGQRHSYSCPQSAGWTVQDNELRYNPTSCVSRLSISLHLVKDGYIEIFYQLPKNRHSLISDLVIRNEQCESYGTPEIFKRKRPVDEDISTGNDWHVKRVNVKGGQNLVVWTIVSNRDLTTLADVIRVPRIEIVGLAYTPICSKCPAGSYSNAKSSQCFGCAAGSYSTRGSSTCTACGINEYSGPKAEKCQIRPNCQSDDYRPEYGKCEDGQIKKSFTKVEPDVCVSPNAPTSTSESCIKCSAGTHRENGRCSFCKKDEYSDGTACTQCPNSTIPEYGLFYTNWEQMPDFMMSGCEYIMAEDLGECPVKGSWIPNGDRIESATTRAEGVALELSLNVTNGFYEPLQSLEMKPSVDHPVARLDFEFELNCRDGTCQLYVVLVELSLIAKREGFKFLEAFNGPQKRQVKSYSIVKNAPVRLVFAFMRSGASRGNDAIDDKAIIYALNLTNVADQTQKGNVGGARRCRQCPLAKNSDGECKPCPQGHYIQEKTSECVKCPEGSALNATSDMIGVKSCVKCPRNMGSVGGFECGFTGNLDLQLDDKTTHFDLTPLKPQPLTANGIKVFPREGNAYYHSFNVSLFNEPVTCEDSYESGLMDSLAPLGIDFQLSDTRPLFCRATAIPLPKAKNVNTTNKVAFVSAFMIGSKLGAITQNKTYKGFVLDDKQLEYDSKIKSTTKPIDIHFYFEPIPSKSASCPNGTIGVVTTRCDPLLATKPEVRTSKNCPDGTCNGCLFHIIVESSFACPICDPSDFDEIKGECLEGKQKIHSIPSKHCVLSGMQSRQRTEACSNVSSNVRLLFVLASGLIVLLILIIYNIHRRNKTLEYRYMRIVEGKEPDDLNTCGLTSDEDEEEDKDRTKVFFNKKQNQKEDDSVRVSTTRTPKQKNPMEGESLDFLSDESA
ncbi:unnamed protein product [Bursaphelenchus okinawaensis]|uniref:Tyrosine-protein kinase ephrin type A/B receptor-like domain-containing protein n=1 Tax=Bursaphelenchus okinawaensis TaxID=465554 RepID=A0A811KU04_9BILA|nr:unnamed protein product [Bursaphelenchus okinawaensis]CAG9112319.1 unnamed protein product [Bursaphelenchus okinawaensis]